MELVAVLHPLTVQTGIDSAGPTDDSIMGHGVHPHVKQILEQITESVEEEIEDVFGTAEFYSPMSGIREAGHVRAYLMTIFEYTSTERAERLIQEHIPREIQKAGIQALADAKEEHGPACIAIGGNFVLPHDSYDVIVWPLDTEPFPMKMEEGNA